MAKGMDMADGGYRSGHTGAFASDTADAAGLVAGALLDAALGDPRRWHPVAGLGRAAAALERRLYAPSRAAGTGYAVLATGRKSTRLNSSHVRISYAVFCLKKKKKT